MGTYIHKYTTDAAFKTDYFGSNYSEPWVSLTTENEEVNFNNPFEKLDYYALASDEHVNFGILNPEGLYFNHGQNGPTYGMFGVYFHNSINSSQISDWGTVFTSGTKEFSMDNANDLLVNGTVFYKSSGSTSDYRYFMYAYQCNKASGNYNNAMWIKSVSPNSSDSGKIRFDTYGSQPWNFISKPTYLGSPIIGHTCTQKIEHIAIMFEFNSFSPVALYPYRNKYTDDVVFMSTDGKYLYPVVKSTLSSWPEIEHEFVNLGLPSATLWATCNVGADLPEEFGSYFAWGETVPKASYDSSTYKYGSSYSNYTKYNSTDGITVLNLEDDAAHVNWGSDNCRIPTHNNILELIVNCTWTADTLNGVAGYTVTGGNGNSIFLPKAGNIQGSSSYDGEGWYWSSTYKENSNSYSLHNSSDGYEGRVYGLTVRPVVSGLI